jgi:hypothetical protein
LATKAITGFAVIRCFKVKNSEELAVIPLFRFARTEDFCGKRRFRRCFILEEQRKQRPWDR